MRIKRFGAMLRRVVRIWRARGEWGALAIVIVALIIGPAAALGYGRWVDRDVITIHARQWAFTPGTITVAEGTPAHLRVISDDVVHGFALAGLGVQVDELWPGHAVDLTFTPKRAGTYYVVCTQYCGVGHGRMLGRLIVRPSHPASR